MNSLKAAICILFFYLLQNALESVFPAVPFPFLVSTVIYFAIIKGPVFGALIGLWAGVLLEASATGRFGTQMALWSAVGFFPGYLSSKVFPESAAVRIILPMIVQTALFFSEFFLRVSSDSWFQDPLGRHPFWAVVLMTLITTPLVFRLFHRPCPTLPGRQAGGRRALRRS